VIPATACDTVAAARPKNGPRAMPDEIEPLSDRDIIALIG
jgi:hypothetical protein